MSSYNLDDLSDEEDFSDEFEFETASDDDDVSSGEDYTGATTAAEQRAGRPAGSSGRPAGSSGRPGRLMARWHCWHSWQQASLPSQPLQTRKRLAAPLFLSAVVCRRPRRPRQPPKNNATSTTRKSSYDLGDDE